MLCWLVASLAALAGGGPTRVDLLRPEPDFPRIYVEAELPNGVRGLFLVDTGADLSVVHEPFLARAGVPIQRDWGQVRGISGVASTDGAVLPWLRVGGSEVREVQVSLNVPGVPVEALGLPLAGILGNNVWSHYLMEVDYARDRLTLHPADKAPRPPRFAEPLWFNQAHVFTPITVAAPEGPPTVIVAQLDTGAGGLTLCRGTGARLGVPGTQGLEAVRGIGASETLPPYRFLQLTRRIPLEWAALGGKKRPIEEEARWIDADLLASDTCDAGFRALVGHEFFEDKRIFFDYQRGRFWMRPGRGRPRPVDAYEHWLSLEAGQPRRDPRDALLRASVRLSQENLEQALIELDRTVQDQAYPAQVRAEAQVLKFNLLRAMTRFQESDELLDQLSVADLLEHGALTPAVDGLILDGDLAAAGRLAAAAVDVDRGDAWARVALADVHLANGAFDLARQELLTAARLEQYPEAHLLRRARLSLAEGDRLGALAQLRQLARLYPFGGIVLWFYASVTETDAERETLRLDLEAVTQVLHPSDLPHDFLLAAWSVLGESSKVDHHFREGLARDCRQQQPAATYDNCRAWYHALAGRDLERALDWSERALRATGPRPDYLDTRAMVHLARGDLAAAAADAQFAARIQPFDLYAWWQAERLTAMAAADGVRGQQ